MLWFQDGNTYMFVKAIIDLRLLNIYNFLKSTTSVLNVRKKIHNPYNI